MTALLIWAIITTLLMTFLVVLFAKEIWRYGFGLDYVTDYIGIAITILTVFGWYIVLSNINALPKITITIGG